MSPNLLLSISFIIQDIDFMKLTYTFGGIAAFLGVSLLLASAFIIAMLVRPKRMLKYIIFIYCEYIGMND